MKKRKPLTPSQIEAQLKATEGLRAAKKANAVNHLSGAKSNCKVLYDITGS